MQIHIVYHRTNFQPCITRSFEAGSATNPRTNHENSAWGCHTTKRQALVPSSIKASEWAKEPINGDISTIISPFGRHPKNYIAYFQNTKVLSLLYVPDSISPQATVIISPSPLVVNNSTIPSDLQRSPNYIPAYQRSSFHFQPWHQKCVRSHPSLLAPKPPSQAHVYRTSSSRFALPLTTQKHP